MDRARHRAGAAMTRGLDPHRPSRRLVQSGASRASARSAGGDRGAGARRSVVAGLARQSAQAGARDMAPLAARLASARRDGAPRADPRDRDRGAARHALHRRHARASCIARYPKRRFIWLMGADNLAQFHRWRDWREIAREVPIAVIARPGYDGAARAAPAMGWLRRFVRPAGQAKNWTTWRLPALVLLRFRPDPTSATALRGRRSRLASPISVACATRRAGRSPRSCLGHICPRCSARDRPPTRSRRCTSSSSRRSTTIRRSRPSRSRSPANQRSPITW